MPSGQAGRNIRQVQRDELLDKILSKLKQVQEETGVPIGTRPFKVVYFQGSHPVTFQRYIEEFALAGKLYRKRISRDDSYVSFVRFTAEQEAQFENEITSIVKERQRGRVTEEPTTVEGVTSQVLPHEAMIPELGQPVGDGGTRRLANSSISQNTRDFIGHQTAKKNALDEMRMKIDQGFITKLDVARFGEVFGMGFFEAEKIVEKMGGKRRDGER